MHRARSAITPCLLLASVLAFSASAAGQWQGQLPAATQFAPATAPDGTEIDSAVASTRLPAPAPLRSPASAYQPGAPPVRVSPLAQQVAYVQPAAAQPAQAETATAPAGDTGTPNPNELVVPFTDEPYELDIPLEIGNLTGIVIRPRSLADAQLITPSREQGPPFVAIIAKRKGRAEITLVGDKGAKKYLFRWVPSLRDLESILLHQFPNSSLRLTQAAENIIIVDGAVDSAAEIEPILSLLQNFLQDGKVINAMQIVGPMQVQLEVTIARVDRTKLRQLGFNFTQSDGPWYSGSQVGGLINTPPIQPPTGALFPFPGAATLDGSSTMTGASTLFLGLTKFGSSFGAYLEALEQQNALKVLARPVLVTMSGRPAEFLNGGEQPYLTVAGVSQNPNVSFKPFGTRLNFVPVVMGQGRIRLDLAPSVSRIDPTQPSQIPGSFLPLVIKQSLHASVEMESGQTLIMGGMYETSSEAVVRKVPCLGSLPLVGAAFRRVSHVLREQELMVFVTPRLVHPLDPHQAPTRVPGDETRCPTDHELYCQGLPEVENCFFEGGPVFEAQPAAPLQYPAWDPTNRDAPRHEALPFPTMNPYQPPDPALRVSAVGPSLQRLPSTGPVGIPPAGNAIAPVQWLAPLPAATSVGLPPSTQLPAR